MTKKKGGKSKNTNQGMPKSMSSAVVVYRGPIQSVDRGLADDGIIVTMSAQFPIAGGAVGLQLSTASSQVTGCADWAGYSAAYDEFRVLGYSMRWLPNFPDGNNSVAQSAGIVVSTHSPANPGPFTSLNQSIQYGDWTYSNTGRTFMKEWRMSSTEEAQFAPVSSPVPQGWINAFFPAATSTGTYGIVVNTFVVQFRGRS